MGSIPGARADAPPAGFTQVILPSEWLARLESLLSSSGSQRTADASEEDLIHLLFDSEALEMVECDLSVTPENSWKPPTHMARFLAKHFDRCLTDAEREAILKNFPRPEVDAPQPPKLDEEVKEQLKRSGKDPHFGAEKHSIRSKGNY